MANKYFVWKNVPQESQNIEWLEMSGKEFYQLLKSPAARGRYFIDMDDFIMEVPKAEHDKWHREKERLNYREKKLQERGFTVISLEDYESSSASLSTLKNNFNSGTYQYLLVKNTEPTNDLINEITTQTNATTITVNMMDTLSEEDRQNNENYFTIMEEFLNNLKTITNY